MNNTQQNPLWVDHDDTRADATDLPENAEITLDGVSRRTFLGVMGASAALAGVGLQGCVRKPSTAIVPYRSRPEDLVPGKAQHYATASQEGLSVTGLLVESHEGRPTKIEGNPQHPESRGATSATVQASVLGLYDLDRSTLPRQGETTLTWDAAWKAFDAFAASAKAGPLAVVTGPLLSPTERRLLGLLKSVAPGLAVYNADVFHPTGAFVAAARVAGDGAIALPNYENANVVAAFDCDFLGREAGSVRATKGYSSKRRIVGSEDPMNRLYAVEANFSITGASADHRLRARSADIGGLLVALRAELLRAGVSFDRATTAAPELPVKLEGKAQAFIAALAKDLAGNPKAGLVVVGHRQPAWVHGLALAINQALEAIGPESTAPLTVYKDVGLAGQGDLKALADALTKGTKHVVVLGANPAYASAPGLKLAELLKAAETVHCGLHADETAAVAKLHIPLSHDLESWGDLATLRGVAAIVQPLIEPLHHTPARVEVLSRLIQSGGNDMYRLVRDTWKASEAAWQTWLHDGLIASDAFPGAAREATELKFDELGTLFVGVTPADPGALAVEFFTDSFRLDGRYANNAWLQEAPDPMTKIAWDNAALMSQKTASEKVPGADNGQLVDVKVGAATVTLPLFVMPGLADGVVGLMLGHGRKQGGKVASLHGFDVYPLLPADGWIAAGEVTAALGSVRLANVQPFGNSQSPIWGSTAEINDFGKAPGPVSDGPVPETIGYRPRSIVFEATRADYAKRPDFTTEILDQTMATDKLKSHMYPADTYAYFNGVHQWGLSIDLGTCTGCNACMIACQAENNIPVVGKDRVLQGREMAWIRLDRYFVGDADDPQAVLQPLGCMHCATAPCEAVCPVKATAHSNEGLNDMAYNRCIGTRYCANNCPYKVRRFNFFNFNLDIHPLEQMQKNPDVTIRFRGVIEKCTYCVQRINGAKIEAKIHGDGKVPDGTIATACQAVCPADAIVFGDISDANSSVSKLKKQPRDYAMLRELNTKPRTTYLAKIRNPNPDLV